MCIYSVLLVVLLVLLVLLILYVYSACMCIYSVHICIDTYRINYVWGKVVKIGKEGRRIKLTREKRIEDEAVASTVRLSHSIGEFPSYNLWYLIHNQVSIYKWIITTFSNIFIGINCIRERLIEIDKRKRIGRTLIPMKMELTRGRKIENEAFESTVTIFVPPLEKFHCIISGRRIVIKFLFTNE